MPAEHFEIAVVGGGKGGKTLAAKMASAGRPTVMVEKGMIGGTCINVACIPTKTMVKSAKVAELARGRPTSASARRSAGPTRSESATGSGPWSPRWSDATKRTSTAPA